jgi:hypothetical protein
MEGLQNLQFLMRFLPPRPSRNGKHSNTTWLHTCNILHHIGVITKSSNPRSISSLDPDNPHPADPIPAIPISQRHATKPNSSPTTTHLTHTDDRPAALFALPIGSLALRLPKLQPPPPNNNNNNNQKNRCRRNAKPVAEPANRGSDFKASAAPRPVDLAGRHRPGPQWESGRP